LRIASSALKTETVSEANAAATNTVEVRDRHNRFLLKLSPCGHKGPATMVLPVLSGENQASLLRSLTCRNIQGTCVRGIAGSSPCHRGIPAHAATDDRSHRPSLLRLPPPWRLGRVAYQGLELDLSRFLPYDHESVGATEWREACGSDLWRRNIRFRSRVPWDRWIRRVGIEEFCRKCPCSNGGRVHRCPVRHHMRCLDMNFVSHGWTHRFPTHRLLGNNSTTPNHSKCN
jgi:hypothetical protein